ncbi:MAG: hypothetical protein NXI18_05085 [Alphaproteobacteria bacterium]|nr:hypothetical protein [Alphaproteobacteria bacterium]
MSWKLELVEVGPTSGSRRLEVGWLGEIRAPAIVDDIGLDLAMAHRLLADLQRAVVALQETALHSQADRLRRAFSCSSSRILRISDGIMPAYFCFQLK